MAKGGLMRGLATARAGGAAVGALRALLRGRPDALATALVEAERSRKSAEESRDRLRAVVTTAPVILFALDAEGVVTLSEGRGLAALGFEPGQLVGMPVWDLYPDRPDLLDNCRRALAGESFTSVDSVGGTTLETHWSPIAAADGSPAGTVGVVIDISEAVRAREEQQRLQTLVDLSPFGVVEWEPEGNVLAWNHAAERLFGWSAVEAIGRMGPHVPPEGLDENAAYRRRVLEGGGPITFETVRQHKDGSRVPVSISSAPLRDAAGRIRGGISVLAPAGAGPAVEREIARLTRYDMATGLPNAHSFVAQVADRIRAGAGSPVAILDVHLEHLDELRSAFRTHLADAAVSAVAERLRGTLRDVDLLARTGDDEISILLAGPVGPESAAETAQRLLSACRAPYALDGHSVTAPVSIGVAVSPQDGTCANSLVRSARLARDAARRTRAGWARFTPDEQARAETLATVSGELGEAIGRDQLVVHYQPIVSLRSSLILGAEALARWPHPTRGLIMPGEFIPLAEERSYMPALTRRVLERALADHRRWHDAGHALPVLVNVSARDLRDHEFVPQIEELAGRYRVSERWLKLEITERVVIDDPEGAIATLKRLRALGILIALDDFGTGYSSLAYLARLPVDAVKIDRSFIAGVVGDERVRAIVHATIGLAHSLGFRVVAEGVEDEATLTALSEMRCDMAQGFHVARPMPAAELDAWLATAPWRPRPAPSAEGEVAEPVRSATASA
jgi:PAS domain S-box-containing protein/diguanylate cyclase (GGDEF)-like protein